MTHLSYGSKGSTPKQVFQAVQQCFLWESDFLWCGLCGIFTLQTFFMCAKMLHDTAKERQKSKKHNMTSLKRVAFI